MGDGFRKGLDVFFLTAGQASDMLGRTGFLSEGESLLEASWGEPMARISYGDRFSAQVVAWALAEAMRDSTFVVGVVTTTGMHPELEDLNLYYGFRRGFQDHRSLLEAPAHLFELEDFYHFKSVLFMAAAFRWDMTLFSSEEPAPLQLAREQVVAFHHPRSALAKKFEAALTQKTGSLSLH